MAPIQRFEDRHEKILHWLFLLILLSGMVLRSYQYLMGRSLWEDEAHLALNFVTRDYIGLLKPLDYIQAAPPLFLLTVKTFTLLFGNGSCALRALPFVSSILTLPLFYYILVALIRSRIAALAGFLAFAVNIAVIYYSSELKTYELDVATYLLMIYLTISQHPYVQKKRNMLLGIAGCICLLYSNVAFIILFCVGCYILIGWYRNRKVNGGELRILAAWSIVFTAYYFLFVHHHPYAQIQRDNYSFAFPPLPLFGPEFNRFMANSVHEIGFQLLLYVYEGYGFAYVFACLLVIAIAYAIYRKHFTLLLFTCMPILLHFALSLFKIYPFWYRLILYFVPPMLMLTAYGIAAVIRLLGNRIHAFAGAAFAIICACFLSVESFRQFPLWFREVRPALDFINKNHNNSALYITTPYTLYKYYYLTGYARNRKYEGLEWNITPEKYYSSVAHGNANYVLLHATDYAIDGYKDVIEDLKGRGLIVRQFKYMTYTVSEIKPLNPDSGATLINYNCFPAANAFDLNGKRVIAIWSGDAISKPVFLSKGRYKMSVISKGTPLAGIYPHLNMFINEQKILDFNTPADFAPQSCNIVQQADGNLIIKLQMDNDAMDAGGKEDRNAFVHMIYISKTGN